MSRRGWVLFLSMCVLWGIPYLLIKVAVGSLTPGSLVFLRTAGGGLLLLPLAMRRRSLRPLLARWPAVLAYTAIEVALPWFLLSDAERRLSSSLAGLLVASVPLVGAVISLGLAGVERIDARRATGLLVGFGGVAVLLGFDVSRADLGAVVEMAVVAVCYATGALIIARRLPTLPSDGVVTASLLVSALVYLPVFIHQAPAGVPSMRVLAALAGLAVACTAVAFLVFFALIAEAGPLRATVITYVNPAVAVLLGVVVLGEAFSWATAAGFALILAGSFVATRPNRVRPARTIEAALLPVAAATPGAAAMCAED